MDNEAKSVTIWKFEDAPKEYREFSSKTGYETYIVFVPKSITDHFPFDNLANLGSFVYKPELPNGDSIYIYSWWGGIVKKVRYE